MKRKIFAIFAILCLATTIFPLSTLAVTNKYSDVNARDFYFDSLVFFDERNWISGFEDGTFRPRNSLTREQAAILFSRILNLDTQNVSGAPFNDIPTSFRSWRNIAATKNAGILGGFQDNTFMPMATMTRGQMAATINRSFFFRPLQTQTPFTDVNNNFFQSEIRTLFTYDITNGRTPTMFVPNGEVNRGEFITLIKRTFDFLESLDVDLRDAQVNANGDTLLTGMMDGAALTQLDVIVVNSNGTRVANRNVQINAQGNFQITLEGLADGTYTAIFTNRIGAIMGQSRFMIENGDPIIDDGEIEDPMDPVDPEDPANPGDPTDPTNPGDPTDPVNPDRPLIDLNILNPGLLDGTIDLSFLLGNNALIRVDLLDLDGLRAGDIVRVKTGNSNLLSVTLTQADIDRGFRDISLNVSILERLGSGSSHLLNLDLLRGNTVIDSTDGKNILLPTFPTQLISLNLGDGSNDVLSRILSGERALQIDLNATGIGDAKVGDRVVLNFSGGTSTTITLTQTDIDRGFAEFRFTQNFLTNLLGTLTVGSSVEITPVLQKDGTSVTGTTSTFVLSQGLLNTVDNLLGGILRGLLGGLFGGLFR